MTEQPIRDRWRARRRLTEQSEEATGAETPSMLGAIDPAIAGILAEVAGERTRQQAVSDEQRYRDNVQERGE